jgi:hypothetical protein
MKTKLAATVLLLLTRTALANDSVSVPDASQLSWQVDMYANKVWLQNLNQFDSSFGASYKYYIDLTIGGGPAAYAAVLAAAASGMHLTVFVVDKLTATTSAVNFVGK